MKDKIWWALVVGIWVLSIGVLIQVKRDTSAEANWFFESIPAEGMVWTSTGEVENLGYSGNIITHNTSRIANGIRRLRGLIVPRSTTRVVSVPEVPSASGLLEVGPMVGYVSSTEMSLWVAPSSTSATVQAWYKKVGDTSSTTLDFPAVAAANGESTSVRLTGLTPDSDYTYEILVNGVRAAGHAGSFTTPPNPGTPFTGKIAVVSCNNPDLYDTQPIYNELRQDLPGMLLHLGDTHYANSTVTNTIKGDTFAQRQVPEFAAAIRNIPSLATWDDHDFCGNDLRGVQCANKANALAVWQQMYDAPAYGEAGNPGNYYKVAHGDVDVFVIDDRYYSNADTDPDAPGKLMLGETQFQWLEREVASSTAKFKLIAGGSTIFASNFDGWSLYTTDRTRLLALTKTVPGIVFLSGDIHTSYVERRTFVSDTAGYPIYDIVSSGVAVDTSDERRYYTTIDFDTTIPDPTLTVTINRFTTSTVEDPASPNNPSTPLEYQDQWMHTKTIALSELQLPSPTTTYFMQTSATGGFDSGDNDAYDAITSTMSIAMWVRNDAAIAATSIMFRRYGGSAMDRVFQFNMTPAGEFQMLLNGPSAGRTTSGASIATSTWAFLMATYDGHYGTSNERMHFIKGQNGTCGLMTKTGASTIPTSLTGGPSTTIGYRLGGGMAQSTRAIAVFNTSVTTTDACAMYTNWVNGTDRDWSNNAGIVDFWDLQESYNSAVQMVTGTSFNEPLWRQIDVP